MLTVALAGQSAVTLRNLRFRLLGGRDVDTSGDERAGGHGRDHRLQRLESVLFLAREPLTTRKLSQYANLADGTEARTLIGRLNELYDRDGRSFRVERVAGGYQLLTRSHFATWVRRLQHVPRETRLSAPALETLSVVAYRQPVLRADIEAIRGVNCGEILRQLMERDLVRIGGRSDELGRPYLYTTTRRFLQMFGLDSLECLPRVAAMQSDPGEGLVSRRESAIDCSRSSQENETGAVPKEEDSKMGLGTLSGLDWQETVRTRTGDETLEPQVTAFDEDDDDYDEFYDEDEEYEDEEDIEDQSEEEAEEAEEAAGESDEEDEDEDFEDFEDEDEDEDEDFDDEDFEDDDEWEEVDDEEEDSDWDDEDSEWDDEDEEEDEEEDWD